MWRAMNMDDATESLEDKVFLLDKNQRDHFGKRHPVRTELQITLCKCRVITLHTAVEVADRKVIHQPSGDKADQFFPESTVKTASAA